MLFVFLRFAAEMLMWSSITGLCCHLFHELVKNTGHLVANRTQLSCKRPSDAASNSIVSQSLQAIILTTQHSPHEDNSHKPQHGQENNCQVQESARSSQEVQIGVHVLLGASAQGDSRECRQQKGEQSIASCVLSLDLMGVPNNHIMMENTNILTQTRNALPLAHIDTSCWSCQTCFSSMERTFG